MTCGWKKQWMRRFKVPVKVIHHRRRLTLRHWRSWVKNKVGKMNDVKMNDNENGSEMKQIARSNPEYPSKRYNRLRRIGMMKEECFKSRMKLRWRQFDKYSVVVFVVLVVDLVHKTGAWCEKDLFEILRREELAGRWRVIMEEERVELLFWRVRRLWR